VLPNVPLCLLLSGPILLQCGNMGFLSRTKHKSHIMHKEPPVHSAPPILPTAQLFSERGIK
jgi:hypothetical protein